MHQLHHRLSHFPRLIRFISRYFLHSHLLSLILPIEQQVQHHQHFPDELALNFLVPPSYLAFVNRHYHSFFPPLFRSYPQSFCKFTSLKGAAPALSTLTLARRIPYFQH